MREAEIRKLSLRIAAVVLLVLLSTAILYGVIRRNKSNNQEQHTPPDQPAPAVVQNEGESSTPAPQGENKPAVTTPVAGPGEL